MKTLQTMLLFLLLPVAASQGGSTNTEGSLYIPEGQLLSEPITVYVANNNITKELQPTLQLVSLGTSTRPDGNGQYSSELLDAAPGQNWTEVVAGKDAPRAGTMLIFRVKANDVSWYKAAVRLNPKLSWSIEQTNQSPIMGDSLRPLGLSGPHLACHPLDLPRRGGNRGIHLALFRAHETSRHLSYLRR